MMFYCNDPNNCEALNKSPCAIRASHEGKGDRFRRTCTQGKSVASKKEIVSRRVDIPQDACVSSKKHEEDATEGEERLSDPFQKGFLFSTLHPLFDSTT